MRVSIKRHTNRLTLMSGMLIGLGFIAKAMQLRGWSDGLLLAATAVAVLPIAVKAWQAVRMRAFSIELLVVIAVLGAISIREYVESSVVTFLFLFGAYLENRTLQKTRSSLRELIEMAPQEAILLQEDGTRVTIGVDEVKAGDRIVVLPGGKIPVDGVIVKGRALVNEAAITGESAPVSESAEERVFSGSLVDTGYLELLADKVGDETTFAKIIELVEEAQDSKSKTERFLDRFSTYYTPSVTVLALLVYSLTRDLHLAITFLVIACPGALVIGAPVSNVAGIGNGAKNGVLIKGGEAMERFAKVDTLVFDKTGTLTKGKPEVTDLHPLGSMTAEDILGLAAKAETLSEHHLGETIVKEARKQGVDLNRYRLTEGEAIKGHGVLAVVDGRPIALGNRKLMEAEGIPMDPEAARYAVNRERAGNTAIFIAIQGQLEAILSVADQIRDDAPAALAAMRDQGVKRIIMLTGDNRHTAEAVAKRLGMDEWHAELLPHEKVAHVKRLKAAGAVVAMAGDGVNDAPAIAAADIGTAMGEGGTDISMETADVVLMADRLSQYAHAKALSMQTIRNLRQNIILALAVVAILLVGVLGGQVHMAGGMFIHEGSVLIVIANGMRLLRFRSTASQNTR